MTPYNPSFGELPYNVLDDPYTIRIWDEEGGFSHSRQIKAFSLGILLFLFLFLFLVTSLQAQTFSSRKLTEIGELFPKSCLPPTDSIFPCSQITKGKPFIVKYNSKNEIEHLGISLFSPESKEMINTPVCNFIERIMLELLLQKSTGDIQSKLREYKVRLQKDGVEYGRGGFNSLSRELERIQSPARFALRKDSVYTAFWEFGTNEWMSLSFPASRELIFGTDKKESDENIGESFTNNDCRKDSNVVVSKIISGNELTPVAGTDLYRRKGEMFIIAQINTDTYYQRSDSLYSLIFNLDYPNESLVNLFLTKQIKSSLLLKITHRMYGGFTPEFTVPLDRFICLFDEGFAVYCSLHRSDSKEIQVSVVLHNRDFNYIHLLRVHTSAEQLFSGSGILTADLYTNIPLHNLKNLFQQ